MSLLPSGIPTALANLIQTNMLSRNLKDGLRPNSMFRNDFRREVLPPHTGETMTLSRLGMFDVDLLPAEPLGDISYASFNVEQWTARPIPYAKGFKIDGPTAYVQLGNYIEQNMKRISEWGGRTASRKARGRLAGYFGGHSMIRATATSGVSTTLTVNSLMGFRSVPDANGSLVAVSSSNPLAVTIVAATTFTANVTGVTPADANFPDGPGTLTLSTAVSAAAAEGSYVYATNTRPYRVRAGERGSTDALQTTDAPTLANILRMRSRLMDTGIPHHQSSGTFHIHGDSTLLEQLGQDTAWRQAYQGAGVSPIFGPGAYLVPGLGLTMFENNDSYASGKGKEVHVGAVSGDLNKTMKDVGLDTINKAGGYIRRAIMTGDDVGMEAYVDEMLYFEQFGIKPVGQVTSNLSVYQFEGGAKMVSGEVDGWRLTVVPAMDPRALVLTVAISMTADWVLAPDYNNAAAETNLTPFKRGIGLEYGSTW